MIKILILFLFFHIPSVYAQTAVEYLQSGNESIKQDRLDQAIAQYTKAIDIDPNYAKAYDNRGVAYAREGSFERAIDDFTLAIAINPKNADAYNNRGRAYEGQGNLMQAIGDYTHAIAVDHFYVKAYNNRALAYFKIEKYDEAWSDVHTTQAVGGTIVPGFIEALRKASGRDK